MLAARLVRRTDDRGDVREDFMRAGLMGKPKRRFARERTAADEHDLRVRAVKVLKLAGFHHDEIAVVADRTDRWVRNVVAELRELEDSAERGED